MASGSGKGVPRLLLECCAEVQNAVTPASSHFPLPLGTVCKAMVGAFCKVKHKFEVVYLAPPVKKDRGITQDELVGNDAPLYLTKDQMTHEAL